MKKTILRICWLVSIICCLLMAYGVGRADGKQAYIESLRSLFASRADPNYDPNDWVISEPLNPVLYIDDDLLRLQVGSSIKYVEIGDPCVTVSFIEPRATNTGIEFDSDPNEYGVLIKNCSFNVTDPNCF